MDFDFDQVAEPEPVTVDRTLTQIKWCHVFRIPPQRGAAGHRASDWPSKPSWSGTLKIVARGDQAAVILIDSENKVFATSRVGPGSVERTVDSGRYFVLRIENAEGKKAFIGLAFNERSDAFDFNVALQEFDHELDREKQTMNNDDEPLPDLSLKDGEKIKINILFFN